MAESLQRSLNLERAEWTITFPANLPASAGGWVRDLTAAAPLIERQVREQVAREIEAQATERMHLAYASGDQGLAYQSDTLTEAARIARGEQP